MECSIPHLQLDAFAALVAHGSVTEAAHALRITQPALSIRLRQLERHMQARLWTRLQGRLQLTAAGERVMGYLRAKRQLDEDLFRSLGTAASDAFSGSLRIAGHFSVVNHVAIPAFAKLFRASPALQVEFLVREDDLVPHLLRTGQCDLALLQYGLQEAPFDHELLGAEEYVLIESTRFKENRDCYLDSDPSDTLTRDFFATQRKRIQPKTYRRGFFHSEAGIVRGVVNGFGRAVVAAREMALHTEIRRVAGFQPYYLPVYLHTPVLSKQSTLIRAATDALRAECATSLRELPRMKP